jgi:16S rRNA (adenine1518-N6/adenine1519-N6)-dimethyltransferase
MNVRRMKARGAKERRTRTSHVEKEDSTSESTSLVDRSGRRNWEIVRGELDRIGFRPSRRLGQNFLLDENMLAAIVRDARLPPAARVLEVGAGCGFLSLHLARAGVELTSVEIDARVLEIARRLLAGERSVKWILADALSGKNALSRALLSAIPPAPWHLVSNLPYSIAAPLLALLARGSSTPESMTVLVQREVAQRIAARPGTSDWGPLSIRLQLEYAPELVRTVPAALFWPRPDVESALVRLERKPSGSRAEERDELDALVARVFQRRRQTLGRVMGEILDRSRARALLADLGLDPSLRAEALDLDQLRRLCQGSGRETDRDGASDRRKT